MGDSLSVYNVGHMINDGNCKASEEKTFSKSRLETASSGELNISLMNV